MTRWHVADMTMGAFVGVALVAMTVLGGYAGWQSMWPAKRWYDLRSVTIADAALGDMITVHVDRSVNHSFTGRYTVVLLDVETGQVVCEGGDQTIYLPGRELPGIITLDWWTDGAEPPCEATIYRGLFRLETCVEILHEIPLIGRREDCATSNVFKINGRPAAP
jgi:hypothetical protein